MHSLGQTIEIDQHEVQVGQTGKAPLNLFSFMRKARMLLLLMLTVSHDYSA